MTEPPAKPKLSPAQRAQQRRDEKLAEVDEEIASGRLTVRTMSDDELKDFDERSAQRRAASPPRRGSSR